MTSTMDTKKMFEYFIICKYRAKFNQNNFVRGKTARGQKSCIDSFSVCFPRSGYASLPSSTRTSMVPPQTIPSDSATSPVRSISTSL